MEARALGRTGGLMFLVVLFLMKTTAGGFANSSLVTETYLSADTEDSDQSTDLQTSSRAVISEGTARFGYSSTSEISHLHPRFSKRESHTGKSQRHDCTVPQCSCRSTSHMLIGKLGSVWYGLDSREFSWKRTFKRKHFTTVAITKHITTHYLYINPIYIAGQEQSQTFIYIYIYSIDTHTFQYETIITHGQSIF